MGRGGSSAGGGGGGKEKGGGSTFQQRELRAIAKVRALRDEILRLGDEMDNHRYYSPQWRDLAGKRAELRKQMHEIYDSRLKGEGWQGQ